MIVTHQNVPHGPLLTEEALASALCAGTVNVPGIDAVAQSLIASIFIENRPELILRAAAEIHADIAIVNQLYRESVADRMHRSPAWELAMSMVLPLPDGNPNALKGNIHADWLRLDPDELRAAIPTSLLGRVSTHDIAEYSRHDAPGLAEAFACWYGVRTRSGDGLIYASDWDDFLSDLKRARTLAADPDFDMPDGGVVYRG
ncbi:hypothetical protein DVT68_00255 [Dyella solisilvae]|uniref:Uncharacterized protein n=2 Tax=Dyella solisilvae TaxID=1920168 RepID=A0A370K9L2_9GAMM|nr:hypothetical protein DVT68_00255 [Dyella solisilvae]